MKNLTLGLLNQILPANVLRQNLFRITRPLLCVAFAAIASPQNAVAQTTKPTDGATPLGLQAGSPAGSYSLSGFDNVNLYNGSLSFALPLLGIGGRGGASHTIMLPIERKWMVEKTVSGEYTWTIPIDERPEQIKPGYGPGMMAWRFGGSLAATPCPTPPEWNPEDPWDNYRHYSGLMRLSFVGPDGTETEFRDVATGGQAQMTANYCEGNPGYNRGKVFVSVDGSGTTFIADGDVHDSVMVGSTPEGYGVIGYMYLRDGTVYRFDGNVSWIRDRNGNKISFQYDAYQRVTSITDSLNRQITIAYDVNEGGSYGVCDKITFKGFNGTYGTTRVLRISKTSLGNALRSGYSLTTPYNLFPGLSGDGINNYNPTVVSSVWLPDADGVTRRYQFQYNSHGELARVVLPTGGAYEYDYGGGTTDTASGAGVIGGYPNYQIYRRIKERRVYADGSNLTSRSTYSLPETQSGGGISTVGYVTVQQFDASSNLLAMSRHYFQGPGAAPSLSQAPNLLASQSDGREYQTDLFDTNGTTVLRRSVNTWSAGTPIASNSSVNINYRVTQTVTTLEPSSANLVSKQTFSYDQYNNNTDTYDYGFGSGSAGSLVRRTSSSFVTANNSYDYACDPSSTCSSSANPSNMIHLRNLPSQVSTYDSGGTLKGSTTFEYDNYATDTNHAPLVDRSSISGLDAGFTTSYTKRGNVTGTTRYLISGGSLPNCGSSPSSCLSTYAQYDIAGNVVKSIDARGYATVFEFTDRFGSPDGDAESNTAPTELSTPGKASYAFATRVTNALSQSSYLQFDYYLGKPIDAEDANGVAFSGFYNDALDRVTKVIRANGVSGLQNQTTFSYDDANRTVTTASDLSSNTDGALVNKTIYDALGRTSETRQYEGGSNYIAVQTQYDAMGRAYRVSNPFRPQSESAVWTTSVFDALGRVTSVSTPDSAMMTTSYTSNTVTVTDQAGKARKSVSDALGRLTAVYENPAVLNYETSYSYDVLDNLTGVTQGAQTRTFVYDSLKRLTSVTNPESGTVSYGYDANGNLSSKTDARSITTTIAYDALNRVTSKSYNDSPQTPTVNYYYDSQSVPSGAPTYSRGYSTGRLVAVTYGGTTAGSYYGFDAAGQVVRKYQQTDSVNYLIESAYNLANGITSVTYPSVPGASDRRTVSFMYDSAARVSALSSSATSYAPAASVSSIGYSAHNSLQTETYGNNLIHAISYNNRLQATDIKLGTSGNPTSVIALSYSYGTTNNNGNVLSHSYSGGGLSYTQSFGYDAVNRLTTSSESGSSWSQTNAYDRYGNRQIDYGGGTYNLSFSSSTNRITTSGYSYDSAGNLTNDTVHTYSFDAENKIVKVDTVSAYVYDGEGQRVRKLVGENTRFVYGIGGELIAEFDGSSGNLRKEYIQGGSLITIEPTAVNSNGTRYTVSDHLGSPRVVTNSAAAVVSRHDYMPFGEELGSGVGGRTTGMGFNTADGLRQKFTSHERDIETGLDYMKARYYHGFLGRFTSADPLLASGRPPNPQSWNRYSYVLNNPVRLVDPTGYEAQDNTNPDQAQRKDSSQQPAKVDETTKDGVKVTVTQLTEPVAFDNKPIAGKNRTGVGVQLVIKVEENGKPASGATGTEDVEALKGDPVQQNKTQVTLDAQGRASDFVTNSAPTPTNQQEARDLVKRVMDPFITEQKAVFKIKTPAGTVVEITHTRSLTNQTPEGRLQPVDPALGTPGYTFKMDPIQLKVTRSKGK
ncbi:MAG TPA: RHS repeat-associated core domain-containing protein [Pyrinomonadaceae bacterium]|nr:RHS repeat-associated core domain-containing protein [Pyrinomonadaceae bacterium]